MIQRVGAVQGGEAVGECDSPTASAAASSAPGGPVDGQPLLTMSGATLALGGRTLWNDLELDVQPGEFITVLGSNGSGKTSLLRAILGEYRLAAGALRFAGEPVRRGDQRIGYVPQQRLSDPDIMLRGRDLVALGLAGHRWGTGLPRRVRRAVVDAVIADVGASGYAHRPLGRLSGGEQQRLRVAQGLVGDPQLLLCDEPLGSLDLRRQAEVVELIDRQRRKRGCAVIFVTHDINPVLRATDRVLYLGNQRFRSGSPDEVLRSDVLSELYQAPVEVVRAAGRILVAGAPDASHHLEGVAQ